MKNLVKPVHIYIQINRWARINWLTIFIYLRQGNIRYNIVKFFNKLFSMGYFPKEWSEGFIIPLHKKGA